MLKIFMKWYMNQVSLFLLILVVFSCTGSKQSNEIGSDTVDAAANSKDLSILQYRADMKRIFKGSKAATLTNSELEQIDEILKDVVKDHNSTLQSEYFKIDLKKKKRQYVAVINKAGEKEVWLNFFCHDFTDSDWRKEIIQVFDGGNCYFNLKINLTKKKAYDLMVNGYA